MSKKNNNCSRKKFLKKELIQDWDELNISFKVLIIVGIILFIVVLGTTVFSNGAGGTQGSLEVVFRTTLASVFGFLLSSNIKMNSSKKNNEMQLIKSQLINLEKDIDTLDITRDKNESECDLKEFYDDRDINLVQIFIALSICIICIGIICILIVTGKLQNIAAISQIRDSMCSSVGFLICESRKNRK